MEIGPGRYLVRARWRDARTGKRRKRQRIVEGSIDDAVRMQLDLKQTDTAKRPVRVRFADYVEQWLKMHSGDLAPSTRERYIGELAHAVTDLGDIYVDALRTSDVREWVAAMSRSGAAATVNGRLRTLRAALNDAVADGMLGSNPARAVKARPERRTAGARGTALNAVEFRRVLAVIDRLMSARCGDPATGRNGITEDIARMILTLAWTGMRRGELLALRWSDYVDGELHIQRSVWRRQTKATKSDDPRVITVVEPLQNVLTAQREWLLRTQHPGLGSNLVFPASPRHAAMAAEKRGDEIAWFRSSSVLDKPMRLVAADAAVPRISPHSFRRTWEDLLRRAGVDQLVRRAYAGWRTEDVEADYASVSKEERDQAGERVVAMILGASGAEGPREGTLGLENENAW